MVYIGSSHQRGKTKLVCAFLVSVVFIAGYEAQIRELKKRKLHFYVQHISC